MLYSKIHYLYHKNNFYKKVNAVKWSKCLEQTPGREQSLFRFILVNFGKNVILPYHK